MMNFIDVILIALFIEMIVETLKPLWTQGENKLSISELVSMGIGILLAVACKINMLSYVVEMDWPYPVWVEYIFYVLTGIAIGRGTNFLYDLWEKLKVWKGGQPLSANDYLITDGIDADNLTDNQLRAVLMQLGAPVEQLSNATRDELERLLDGFAVNDAKPPHAENAE